MDTSLPLLLGDENDMHNDPLLNDLQKIYAKQKEDADKNPAESKDVHPAKLTILITETYKGNMKIERREE